jgi:hypothetical protein
MPIEVVVQMLMLNPKSSYPNVDWHPGFVNFEARSGTAQGGET